MFYIGIVLIFFIVTIIMYTLQKAVPTPPRDMSQDQYKQIYQQGENHRRYRPETKQRNEYARVSEHDNFPKTPRRRHEHKGRSLSTIKLLLSFTYGGFVFMCLMHMGTWGMGDFILALWNMAPLAMCAIMPERFMTSRVFTVIHMVLFLVILTFMTWMAYDLTYVHIDALNAIAFITMPFIAFMFVAVFYSLSLLIFWLKSYV